MTDIIGKLRGFVAEAEHPAKTLPLSLPEVRELVTIYDLLRQTAGAVTLSPGFADIARTVKRRGDEPVSPAAGDA